MEISFHGQRALVTGAARGIGRGIALALAKGGAHVFALDRTGEELAALSTEHPNVTAVVCDLRDLDQTRDKVKAVLPIHLLVNNAMIVNSQPVLEVDMKSFDEVLDVGVRAPFLISQIIAADLIARNLHGSIVNMSSISAQMGFTRTASYGMAKSALDHLTRVMAKEVSAKGVRVNSLGSQTVATEQLKKYFGEDMAGIWPTTQRVPLQRVATVEEVVSVVLFLLSDKASMVNGSYIPVDGGFLISGV